VRVLFDQGTPAPLRLALAAHLVETAYELGWATLKNGELISAAEAAGFEVLLTTDKNLRYQQNLSARTARVQPQWCWCSGSISAGLTTHCEPPIDCAGQSLCFKPPLRRLDAPGASFYAVESATAI